MIYLGTTAWVPIPFGQFQNSSGFKSTHENACPFLSHIASSIHLKQFELFETNFIFVFGSLFQELSHN